MYKHSSVLLLVAAASILQHANAGLVWSVPNGITMPFAKRYSAQDLIFDLRKARSPQYIDTVGCKDFLVTPTLFNRDVSSWDDNLDTSQFGDSTDVVAQLPAGTDTKQYHSNCLSASYNSDNSIVGRDNQPPDYNNLDFLNNPNPFPVGETRTDPWADPKAPNFGTNLEVDNSKTGTTPLQGQDLIASAQTGAYDVPAPSQDTLTVPGGQDTKLPSPGTDYTNTPYNAAYDTTLPNQDTDNSNPTPNNSNPTPNNPSFEQQLADAQYVPSPFPPPPPFAASYTLETWYITYADCHM